MLAGTGTLGATDDLDSAGRDPRGAFDVGAEVAREAEGGEAEEDAGRAEKAAAKAEDLAKFLGAAIEHFEQTFDITPEAVLDGLDQVVKGHQPARRPGRKARTE